jgi:hypothetical protein
MPTAPAHSVKITNRPQRLDTKPAQPAESRWNPDRFARRIAADCPEPKERANLAQPAVVKTKKKR